MDKTYASILLDELKENMDRINQLEEMIRDRERRIEELEEQLRQYKEMEDDGQ